MLKWSKNDPLAPLTPSYLCPSQPLDLQPSKPPIGDGGMRVAFEPDRRATESLLKV